MHGFFFILGRVPLGRAFLSKSSYLRAFQFNRSRDSQFLLICTVHHSLHSFTPQKKVKKSLLFKTAPLRYIPECSGDAAAIPGSFLYFLNPMLSFISIRFAFSKP